MLATKSSRKVVHATCHLDDLAKTPNQVKYTKLLKRDDVKLLIATGPAGTGKTMIGCTYAMHGLINKNIAKIVITRPTISMEEELGFMPGKLEDKMNHWLTPIYDSFNTYTTSNQVKEYVKSGKIEIAPLGFIRGRTFHNSWIIVDEAQNINCNQMKTLLTRIGQNSKMVLAGDLEQCDLRGNSNGLADFIGRLEQYPTALSSIKHVELTEEDVMRSDVVKHVLNIYKNDVYLGNDPSGYFV